MRMHACIAGLGLATVLLSQDPDATSADHAQPRPYPALQARVGGHWFATWNPATGTPRAVWGTGAPLGDWRGSSLDEARRHAHRLLAEHGAVIGVDGTSEFREAIGQRMGRVWSFKFDQYFRGLPVIGGRADVRIHSRGALAMFGSTAWPVPADFDVTPGIGELQARANAWLHLGLEPSAAPQPAAPQEPRLVIWGDVGAASKAPFHLCWEVAVSNVQADGSGPIGRCYVDARTGRVHHYENDKHECWAGCRHPHHAPPRAAMAGEAPAPAMTVPTTVTVMAWTRTGLNATSPLVNIPVEGLVVTVPGLGTRTTDAAGQFVIDIAAPVSIAVGALDGVHCAPIQGTSQPAANATVTPGVPATIQLLTSAASQEEAAHTSVLHWTRDVNEWVRTILGNTGQLNTLSGISPRVNITQTCNAYYTSNTINFYATGGSCNNTAFSTVIAHEWGHGLDHQYGGISNGNGNGLSEAWADIVGMYLVDDPVIGPGFRTNGGAIRSGTNTRQFTSLTSSTGPHASGECFMGMAWKLRQNLRGALGAAQALAVSEDIVLGSIIADATNQPDAVREIQLADDDDANLLNGTPHHAWIKAACQAHSLPFQDVVVGQMTHSSLANTTVELTPRLVVADVAPFLGAFTAVRVHYQPAGGTAGQVPMIGTGTPDRWQALLPGVAAGTTLSYHFEAVHTSAATLRLPETGEFSYHTGNDLIVFAEHFDGGSPGWTHALVRQQDDWQNGPPQGRTGSGWADPSAAVSGSGVYGNDLGPSGFNGAYQNNVTNYLRSPVFSCAGHTGIRLRFQRWLTVEEGQFDQATISVGGQQVWVNPFAGHLLDTSWQAVEIPIPQADNNPSVQLEWRLNTDGGLVFGGWNIDDVEVVASVPIAPLPVTLQLVPAQASSGTPMALSVRTNGMRPYLWILGDGPGPTSIPGVPTLSVGGTYATAPGWTDSLGFHTLGFPAPQTTAVFGLFFYSQALSIDAGLNLVVSNQYINLFTP